MWACIENSMRFGHLFQLFWNYGLLINLIFIPIFLPKKINYSNSATIKDWAFNVFNIIKL